MSHTLAGPGIASHAEGPPIRERFVLLDGVRGVAAIMVLILHAAQLFPNSFLMVDLFFMLSGFVLAHGYGDRIETWAGKRRFVIGRLIRVYPLYLIGCLIALPAATGMAIYGWNYFTLPVLGLAIVTAPFFIILPYDGYTIPLNPPGWSLAFEMIANALFLLTGMRMRCILLIIPISALLLLWGMHLYSGGVTGWLGFWGAFPRTFFSFFMGVLLYRLWTTRRTLPRLRLHALVLPAIVIAACVYTPAHYRNYHALMIFLVNPAIIWIGAHSTVRGSLATAATYLGAVSYGVYVLHVPIIMLVEGIHFLLIGAMASSYAPDGSTAWISIPLSLVAAHHLTFRIEVPLRRRLAARFLPRNSPAIEAKDRV